VAGVAVHELVEVSGYLETQRQVGKHDFFRLKYGKHASTVLLLRMYPTDDVPRLMRKWEIWDRYKRRMNSAEGGT
jgi:hypothetical protein